MTFTELRSIILENHDTTKGSPFTNNAIVLTENELMRIVEVIIERCADEAYSYLDDPILSGHGYATGCYRSIKENV